MRLLIWSAWICGIAILWTPLAGADTIVGTPHAINCFPFGNCYQGEFQEIYSSAAFSEDVDGAPGLSITSMGFSGRLFGNRAFTALVTLSVALSTTSATLGSGG